MIYRVMMDGQSIYAYTEELMLINPSLEIALNSAGSFDFTLPYHHTYYDLPALMTSDVEVYEDGELIWYGRVSEINDTSMNKDKSIHCEGALAFFNDTIQRPYAYQETTVHAFFEMLITRHNDYAPANRRFTVGNITVDNFTIYKELDYQTTKNAIQNECLNAFGGYLVFRKENGVNYIDWIKEITILSPQPVQYALNLVKLASYLDGANLFTSIIPLGKENNGAKTTIASVNQGLDYLDSTFVTQFGRITAIVEFSALSDPSELKLAAERWLATQQFAKLRIECDAAELYYLDNTYQPFRVGQLVHVTSSPHSIDIYLPIRKISIELDNPVKNITIGNDEDSEFTSMAGSGGSTGSYSGGSGGSGGGGGSSITIDTAMSYTSSNPVANRVISYALYDKEAKSVELTQAEYDALTEIDPHTTYYITDG